MLGVVLRTVSNAWGRPKTVPNAWGRPRTVPKFLYWPLCGNVGGGVVGVADDDDDDDDDEDDDDCFYIALFSALQQTHCAGM